MDSKFVGELNDIWFRGEFASKSDILEFGQPRKNLMKNVSFEKAILHDITFSNNCDLSTIILPLHGEYRHYFSWKKRLETLSNIVSLWPENERKEAMIFVNTYMVHAKQQNWFLLNVDDTRKEHGETLTAKIINILDTVI